MGGLSFGKRNTGDLFRVGNPGGSEYTGRGIPGS